MYEQGALDDEVVQDALDKNQEDFVIKALELSSNLKSESIKRILATQNGQVITSLTWKAGLSMRTAMRLQATLGHVAPHKIVNARGGFDFPMKESEMEWHLSSYD